MDMNDILYSIYFLYEWGSEPQEGDKTFDSEYSPKAYQSAQTLVAVRVIDKDTIEVYQNFWHFDDSEIADSAGVWTSMPWEIMSAMEKSVTDGKAAFSRSSALGKNIQWLSLLVPNDASMIKSNLEEFRQTNFIPAALVSFESNSTYYDSRYDSTMSWIEQKNHAIISNGPFYLEAYSPEARTITTRTFDDPTYPFEVGHWKEFVDVKLAKINNVEIPDVVSIGNELTIPVSVNGESTIYYYFTNADNKVVASGVKKSENNKIDITLIPEQTALFSMGANDLKIFVVSDSALRPDIFRTSFLGIEGEYTAPPDVFAEPQILPVEPDYVVPAVAIIAIITGVVIVLKRKRKQH
jgi:peptide/nickel transport system substrate-binding protein